MCRLTNKSVILSIEQVQICLVDFFKVFEDFADVKLVLVAYSGGLEKLIVFRRVF